MPASLRASVLLSPTLNSSILTRGPLYMLDNHPAAETGVYYYLQFKPQIWSPIFCNIKISLYHACVNPCTNRSLYRKPVGYQLLGCEHKGTRDAPTGHQNSFSHQEPKASVYTIWPYVALFWSSQVKGSKGAATSAALWGDPFPAELLRRHCKPAGLSTSLRPIFCFCNFRLPPLHVAELLVNLVSLDFGI